MGSTLAGILPRVGRCAGLPLDVFCLPPGLPGLLRLTTNKLPELASDSVSLCVNGELNWNNFSNYVASTLAPPYPSRPSAIPSSTTAVLTGQLRYQSGEDTGTEKAASLVQRYYPLASGDAKSQNPIHYAPELFVVNFSVDKPIQQSIGNFTASFAVWVCRLNI